MSRIIVPVIAFLYFLWSIDIIPDFIPVAGQADDLIAGIIGVLSMFRKERR